MKVVVNKDFRGYGCCVPEQYADLVYKYEEDRTNSELVAFVENNPCDCGYLQIITIPDNTTDWDIIKDDDGEEIIVCVVDGKIRYC